jgi:hypothetical protein
MQVNHCFDGLCQVNLFELQYRPRGVYTADV